MLVALDSIAPGKAPGLRVSADPVQPREAIDWFGRKTPLDKQAWASLSEEARKRAFTAAWVTDVHVLQSVKDSLRQAIDSGESFENWKKRIRSELGARWSRGDAYLETVFRNNVQSAYAAGRYKAQTTPLILKMRPFWRLVVLLDGRTSEHCKPLGKPPVILPAEHPWWASNFPPRHHRCRATVVTMSRRQAERLGISKAAPTIGAQPGWGSTAGLGEWQPAGTSLAPELFQPARQEAAKVLPKVEPVVEPPAQVVPVVAEAPKKGQQARKDSPKAQKPAPQAPAPAATPRQVEFVVGDYATHARERKLKVAAFENGDYLKDRSDVFADRVFNDTAKRVFAGKVPSVDSLERTWGAPVAGFEIKLRRAASDVTTSSFGTAYEVAFTGDVIYQGKVVGEIGRTFKRREDGTVEVHHDILKITDAGLQGKGLGEAMLRQSIRSYEQIGAHEITVDTAWVGRYTWASFGYNWSGATAERKRRALIDFMVEHGVPRQRAEDIAARVAENAWDVAALDVDGIRVPVGYDPKTKQPRTERIGKAFLLTGEEWSGTLKLDPKHPTYRQAKKRLGL